jgi:hypothetical protein
VMGSITNTTLIPKGAAWRYSDQGLNLGTDWRAPGYNDGSWPSGPAQLGYGDGGEATTNNFGPDPLNKFTTTYYRRAFPVTGAVDFNSLSLSVLRDDGAVIYLNGSEVFRTAMPEGTVTFNTLANVTVVGDDESINFYSSPVDPTLLVEGVNVVAVEIHQRSGDSSDISFDFEMVGQQTLYAPMLTINSAGLLSWPSLPADFVLQVSGSLALGPWQPADITGRTEQNGQFKLSVPLTGPPRFYRLAR